MQKHPKPIQHTIPVALSEDDLAKLVENLKNFYTSIMCINIQTQAFYSFARELDDIQYTELEDTAAWMFLTEFETERRIDQCEAMLNLSNRLRDDCAGFNVIMPYVRMRDLSFSSKLIDSTPGSLRDSRAMG